MTHGVVKSFNPWTNGLYRTRSVALRHFCFGSITSTISHCGLNCTRRLYILLWDHCCNHLDQFAGCLTTVCKHWVGTKLERLRDAGFSFLWMLSSDLDPVGGCVNRNALPAMWITRIHIQQQLDQVLVFLPCVHSHHPPAAMLTDLFLSACVKNDQQLLSK